MTDPLLDEDGYCRKTDLLPYECGCDGHRGGEVVDLAEGRAGFLPSESVDFTDLQVLSQTTAKYHGRCPLCHVPMEPYHSTLYLVADSEGETIGWVCTGCAQRVSS